MALRCSISVCLLDRALPHTMTLGAYAPWPWGGHCQPSFEEGVDLRARQGARSWGCRSAVLARECQVSGVLHPMGLLLLEGSYGHELDGDHDRCHGDAEVQSSVCPSERVVWFCRGWRGWRWSL
jgi:hypothetical protein